MDSKSCLLGLVILSALSSACSSKQTPAPGGGGEAASGGKAALGTKQEQPPQEAWTCPMHPQIRKDGPGQCPICGMNLVKATEGRAESQKPGMPEGHAMFHLSAERQQMIGVKFGVAEKKPLFKEIQAAGRVAFDPELYTAQNEYLEAVKQLSRVQNSPIAEVKHSAERMVESAKLRLKILGLSDKQIAALKEGESQGPSLLLTSPGESVWIYAEVYEMDLASVQPGLSARITGGVLAGKELAGKVVSVDRVLNPATRTAKVRIQVANAKSLLRPESFVNVSILSPLGEQVTVPFDAVLDTGKQAWIFVEDGSGNFEPRVVTLKFQAGDEVAVGAGLTGGERIVTSANFLIDSESRLKGVVAAASAEGAPKTPECPKGQEWHAQMKHCMPKTEN
ncbi:MAG: efflux RND transporter periplasmic adaptor subunit [Oligoflexia bacterium]|nr:efflux RND transporter periplasmic adaptor subunit [Oligoflexia bacterium]